MRYERSAEYKNSSYPLVNLCGGFYVVNSIKQDNGALDKNSAAAPLTTNYSYKNGRIHVQGKGFTGFESMTATNATTGVSVENSVMSYYSDYCIPYQTKTTVKAQNGSTTKTLSETVVDFTASQVNSSMHSKYIRYYPNKKTVTDVDGSTTTTTYTVDNNGNVTSENTTYADNATRTVAMSSFVAVTASGTTIPSLPRTVAVTQRHPDEASNFSSTTSFDYNAKGHVIQKKDNDGIAGKVITSTYEYDAYGNRTQLKLSCTLNGATKETTTTYQYDASNRYVETLTVKAPNNQTETTFYQYDNRGNMLNKRDLYGETHYRYDNWNRPIVTHYPDGSKESAAQLWNSGNIPLYKITQTRTGEPDVTTHYDAAGRKLLTETTGPKNSAVSAEYTYNNKG